MGGGARVGLWGISGAVEHEERVRLVCTSGAVGALMGMGHEWSCVLKHWLYTYIYCKF